MPEWISGTFEWLVNFNMHPGVFVTIAICMIAGKLQFEQPHINAAKEAIDDATKALPSESGQFIALRKQEETIASEIAAKIAYVSMALSVLGQLALYWPRSGQGMALCVFFAVAQYSLAKMLSYYFFKWGVDAIMEKAFRKKVDG